MTGKLQLKSPRVPLVVHVPQFENHCSKVFLHGAVLRYACFTLPYMVEFVLYLNILQ